MKIYYDRDRDNVIIETLNRYFPNSSLEAFELDSKIIVRNINTNSNEIYISHTEVMDKDGNNISGSITDVINYLNTEFAKGMASGTGSFSGFNTTITIVDDRIKNTDIIVVTPLVTGLINDVLAVVNVVNGGFTVTRLLVGVGTLTNNLGFKYKVI